MTEEGEKIRGEDAARSIEGKSDGVCWKTMSVNKEFKKLEKKNKKKINMAR